MKILFSVIFAFFCQIFKNSNAVNKDGYDVFQFYLIVLEKYSGLNGLILICYLKREIILKK